MTYFISHLKVPSPEKLPWRKRECDAFVAILAPELLTDELAVEVSASLVRLCTDWVETMGGRSEYLHDMVDIASVEAAMQAHVGDGNPMTAWHDDMRDVQAMSEYLRSGGLGATDNKLVVVVGSEEATACLAREMQKMSQAETN
jgi:hypothetical protein